jgi:hypothetical protein
MQICIFHATVSFTGAADWGELWPCQLNYVSTLVLKQAVWNRTGFLQGR